MEKQRAVLVSHALKLHRDASSAVFDRSPVFKAEVQVRLRIVVPLVREAYENKGLSSVANRIEECGTYPLYKFVRAELGTQLLSGLRMELPGTEVTKVFEVMSELKLRYECCLLKGYPVFMFKGIRVEHHGPLWPKVPANASAEWRTAWQGAAKSSELTGRRF